jgi:hypothetical protein
MGNSRIFALALTATAVLAVAAATSCAGGNNKESSSTTSSTTAASSTSAAPSPPSGAPPPVSGPLADYTNLLLQPTDVGPDATTTGPPTQNPGGIAGAGVTFTGADRTRTIDDLIIVMVDPATAAQSAKDPSRVSNYVTGTPQPFEVGTNGLITVGLSPDNSKAVTYVTFAEGKAVVDLSFDGPPGSPAPPHDYVVYLARTQDTAVKNGLPS